MSEPLKLYSHKSWFFPADAKTYKVLSGIGFPTTRIHKDSISILKLVLKKHGHSAMVEPFSVRYEKFLNSAAEWCHRYGYKCKVKSSEQSYRFPATQEGRKHAALMITKTRDFWTRWGLMGDINEQELASSIRVVVVLSKATRNPVVKIKKKAELEKRNVLELGTHRLCTSTDNRFLLWELDVKTGPDWRPLARGKQLLTEVSDPSGLIGDLMIAFNAE